MNDLMNSIDTSFELWEYLKNSGRPVFLYGMGDGAVKLLGIMKKRGISCSEIFASDSFVRDKIFQGFKIRRLSEIESRYSDPVILMAFASSRPDVLSLIKSIASRHELYAPDINIAGDFLEVFDTNFLHSNYGRLDAVFNRLYDEASRRVFISLINFKLSGKLCYLDEMLSNSKDIPFKNSANITSYVDLGAYNGDTVLEAFETLPDLKMVTAVEPDIKNFKKLQLRAAGFRQDAELKLVNAAAWDKAETLTIEMGGGPNSSVASCEKDEGMNVKNKKYKTVSGDSLDNILAGRKADLIKFDTEGSEYHALLGCEKTICNYHPKLIISAYHNNRDLFEIPELLDRLCPGYNIKIRFPFGYIPAWETRFYCEFNK